MRFALVNPNWSYAGSVYFGCREPHLPLELAYSRALLERAGHDALVIDAQLHALGLAELRERVRAFAPDFIVVTTAPTYLFWRCPPPELRVPRETLAALRGSAPTLVAVGPHPSVTPGAALRKLGADVAVLGECEEILVALGAVEREAWARVPSIAWIDRGRSSGVVRAQGGPHASRLEELPPLRWTSDVIRRHRHHHHRFDAPVRAPGAELEATRGCPYRCAFCNKETFRNRYRKRPLDVVLDELDGLLAQGVEYVYFIDEIFLPDRALLDALARRHVGFGVQLRIDNWSAELIDLLGRAGCRSIEAGVESISERGRAALDKQSALSTQELAERLIYAKRRVPFVQANLLDARTDDRAAVEEWRARLHRHGVWANKPVPMFPYPGSPGYRARWGVPDDRAWERAHAHYLAEYGELSDLQDAQPRALEALEAEAGGG